MSVLQSLGEKIDGTFFNLIKQYIGLLDDSAHEKREQTFLKKTEPPKLKGDPVHFADFMRKE